jgi:alkyl hydroperoxide reductase subunit AhpC
VLGVIQENPFVARAWAEKIGTELPILADYTSEVAQLYGIWDPEKHRVRRTSFTIDGDGVIQTILQDRDALNVDPGLEACRILTPVDSTD